MVLVPVVSALPGNLLEMQILPPSPDPLNQTLWFVTKPLGDDSGAR